MHERQLNDFPQFTTAIQGQRVHFMHVRSPEPEAMPLIMTHGWPGSIVEFTKVIGSLTYPRAHGGDPADAFHLVVPSIPGYGFSGPTHEPGWNVQRIALAWDELMTRLGYERYGAQGGDWGSSISRELGTSAAGHVIGVHLNMLIPQGPLDQPDLTDGEKGRLDRMRQFRSAGMGYGAIQSTRPQTLAYALTDSPAGQLAWIAEKFREWTDGELPDDAVDRDQMLTNVTLYWLTGTAGSSARLYFETARTGAWGRRHSQPRRPGWPCFLTRSRRLSGALPNCPTTSCTGPSSTAAAISRPWRNPTCLSPMCANSSDNCADASTGPGREAAPGRPRPRAHPASGTRAEAAVTVRAGPA